MESRTRASPEQFTALLEFMERHGDISRPQKGPQGRIKADRLWQELEEILNSMGGGVIRSRIKWKKVWADWKAKTKKKSLAIQREISGTGGGPSSRQTLTASEERVLGIMGLSAVVGQVEIEERGFDAPPSEDNSLPPPTRDTVSYQISATDDNMLEFIPSYPVQVTTASTASSITPFSGELPNYAQTPVQMPLPSIASAPMPSATSAQRPLPSSASAPMPSAASPTASTSRGVPQRQRRHHESPPSTVTPTTSTPRRHRLRRSRRIQTPFERATSEFVAVEHRRLQLEADRDKKYHEREVERLRLEAKRLEIESRRIDVEEEKNQILSRLGGAVDNLIEMLPQLRSSSLPSTDIIP